MSCQQTFTVTTFTTWKAVLLLALQITNVFVWNFIDLFITLIAMGLTARFRQVNAEIEATQDQVGGMSSMWAFIRSP